MSETVQANQALEQIREQTKAVQKDLTAYIKGPHIPRKLRTRADQAIAAFDRGEMKAVSTDARASIELLQQKVLAPLSQPDDDLQAMFKEAPKTQGLGAAIVEVGFLKDAASDYVKELKDIVGDIARTIKKAEDTYAAVKAAEAAIDDVEGKLKTAGAKVVELHAKLQPLHQNALAAAKSRDPAALAKAKAAFTTSWSALDEQWSTIEKTRQQFIDTHLADPVPKAQRDTLAARLDAASKGQRDAAMAHQEAAKWAREVRQLEAAAVDGKKAASVLDLDAKEAGAVAEAMQGDESAVRKKLEALAKRLKLKLSGKDMFERLRKAKLA